MVQITRYDCDLHCHTTRSDGNDSPRQLLDNAASLGLKAVAITDHDIDPPRAINIDGENVDIKSYAKNKGLDLILGYEFSCDTYNDEVHILGFCLNWDNPLIKQEINNVQNSKIKAYQALCQAVTKTGVAIDYEKEILNYTGADGEMSARKPEEVQKKHIFDLMAAKGFFPSWQEAKQFVKSKDNFNIKREKINPLAAIELIHACGGLAVLAH
ncbi:MAG: PHP domain-containing protein, partial [Bacillota bacterium]